MKDASTHEELLEIVTTMSSSTANVFVPECAWACSLELMAFAVPPNAVVLTLNVAVAVPLAQIVAVSVIVPAKGHLTTNL